MIYAVFILIYMIGASGTISRAIMLDAIFRKRIAQKVAPEQLPEPPKFRSYLSCYGLLWPLMIWFVLFFIWEEYIERKE